MILSAVKEYVRFPTIHGHASTLLKRGNEIWMAWWGGSPEPNNDITIFTAKRTAGVWSEPNPIERVGDVMHWNPVFFDAGHHVDLHFNAGPQLYTSVGYRMSTFDDGKTYTKAEKLVPNAINVRGPVRNKLITMKSGRVLAPSSQEYEDGRRDCFVDISDDGGRSFHMSEFVPLLRDGGLPNNNSAIDLVKLSDGCILLVCNPVADDHGNWGKRTPLCLFLSTDDGKTFSQLMTLECVPGEYSYPAIIADEPHIYLSYTCNRTRFAFWTIELEPIA